MTLTSKRAGDIMIPIHRYPNVLHTATLHQAVEIMEHASIDIDGRKSLPRALLVFDEEYHPLGIVRRRDILRGLEPKFMRIMSVPHRRKLFDIEGDPNLVELAYGKIASGMREQAEHPVSEVMQPIVSTVDINDHLAKIIFKMITKDLNLLPVLDQQKVVGVVRSVDVFNEVAHLLED
nr:CBS domain-containing protein [candidate division Zixibacteria bacterium]